MSDEKDGGHEEPPQEVPSREWVSVERVKANQPFETPPLDRAKADGS